MPNLPAIYPLCRLKGIGQPNRVEIHIVYIKEPSLFSALTDARRERIAKNL